MPSIIVNDLIPLHVEKNGRMNRMLAGLLVALAATLKKAACTYRDSGDYIDLHLREVDLWRRGDR
jgi:hypothetical protein